jgi:hypothetical protein
MQRNVMAGEVEMRLLTVPKSNLRKMAGLERLPDGCAGFNEWYVFNSPFDLGELWHGNVFDERKGLHGGVLL